MLETFVILITLLHGSAAIMVKEPHLNMVIKNVTAEVGQTAVLPCSVESLGKYKVVWQDSKERVLTMDIQRILADQRISVERPYTREWNLHIRKVKLSDSGKFMCIINTSPVQIRTIQLHVVEPPKIIEHLSSPSSVRVREGDTVELVCNATGTPTPEVIWYEKPEEGSGVEKKPPIAPGLKTNKNCMYSFKEIQNPGEVLVIYNATRYCAEVYQCMAYNQVRPAAFRDIRVNVEFAPEVTLPTKKIGQILGKATILECSIAAYPHNLNKWKRNGKDIRDQAKYTIELYKEKHNTITLSLRIHSITPEDYGEYECFALNNIGQDSETMILYEYRRETTSTTTTTTTLAPWSRPDNNYNNGDLYPDINSRSGNNGYNTGNSPRYDPNRVKYPDHRNQAGGGWDDARDPYDGWEERKPNGYNREAESNSVRAGRRGDRDTAGHVRPHSLLINIILCISVFYTLMS